MASEYEPAWRHILKSVKYPTDVSVLDFESYFDDNYGIGDSKLSIIEYVMDKRFEVLGLGHLIMRQPFQDYIEDTYFDVGEERVAGYLAWMQEQYGKDLSGVTVVMQNAAYDLTVLAHKYGIYPRYVVDILGLARHWNARTKNDLATLTMRYGLPPKGNTMNFSGVTLRRRYVRVKGRSKAPIQAPLATEQQITELADYGGNDLMREWELLTLLLPKLSNPATELRLMQHTLELFTKPSIGVDQGKGRELITAMNAEIDSVVASVGASREEISGTKSFEKLLIPALQLAGDDPQKYYKQGKKAPILAIARADDEREELLKHPDDRVRSLIQARTAIKSWPLHISRVDRIMRQAAAAGGLLPVPLKYHGAHTGRYAGGEKINLQNLPIR